MHKLTTLVLLILSHYITYFNLSFQLLRNHQILQHKSFQTTNLVILVHIYLALHQFQTSLKLIQPQKESASGLTIVQGAVTIEIARKDIIWAKIFS